MVKHRLYYKHKTQRDVIQPLTTTTMKNKNPAAMAPIYSTFIRCTFSGSYNKRCGLWNRNRTILCDKFDPISINWWFFQGVYFACVVEVRKWSGALQRFVMKLKKITKCEQTIRMYDTKYAYRHRYYDYLLFHVLARIGFSPSAYARY